MVKKETKDKPAKGKQLSRKMYKKELHRLQTELVKFKEWLIQEQLKVAVLFEGRDAAGKGGVIRRITAYLNPRVARVVALAKPTEQERGQWYFQRYVSHLPAAGEIVLFDRSWYNRAGVERVMEFCSDEEYREFLRTVPMFEDMLIGSGLRLVKYWFSVSAEEQKRRLQSRIDDRIKRWKISPMDLESHNLWEEYSRTKDEMFRYTDNKRSPWYVVNSDNKKQARLNCIRHLLSLFNYKDISPKQIKLKRKKSNDGYIRTPLEHQNFVPDWYGAGKTEAID